MLKDTKKLPIEHENEVKRTQETDSAVKVQLLDAGSVLVQRFLKEKILFSDRVKLTRSAIGISTERKTACKDRPAQGRP